MSEHSAEKDALSGFLETVVFVLNAYAPIARARRGCPLGCGCTGCEMVGDLWAAVASVTSPRRGSNA